MRFLFVMLLGCVLAAMPVSAQEFGPGKVFQIVQNEGMTLSEAIESVRRSTEGRIVSAETKTGGSREVHHIKVLTKDGKVKTHEIPVRKIGNGKS